jgi:hypothetical protein
MKSIGRLLKWCLINGFMAVMFYLGIVEKNQGAINVFKFMFWVMVFFNTVIAFSVSKDEKMKAKMLKNRPPLVMRVGMGLFDATLALCLAYLGWFWTAGFAIWDLLVEQGIYFDKEKDNEETPVAGA